MKTLVVIAHPDDECSCAGFLKKTINEGGQVHIVCITGNSIREAEFQKSCEMLKATSDFFGLEEKNIRDIHTNLERLIGIIKKFRPDIAITHSKEDYHPHHRIVFDFVSEAVEFSTHGEDGADIKQFLSMEDNSLFSHPDYIIDISEEFPIKISLMECHSSELNKKHKKGYYTGFIDTKAKLRGIQSGVQYGEAYCRNPLPVYGDFYSRKRAIKSLKEL